MNVRSTVEGARRFPGTLEPEGDRRLGSGFMSHAAGRARCPVRTTIERATWPELLCRGVVNICAVSGIVKVAAIAHPILRNGVRAARCASAAFLWSPSQRSSEAWRSSDVCFPSLCTDRPESGPRTVRMLWLLRRQSLLLRWIRRNVRRIPRLRRIRISGSGIRLVRRLRRSGGLGRVWAAWREGPDHPERPVAGTARGPHGAAGRAWSPRPATGPSRRP